jgi:hypothetical protein
VAGPYNDDVEVIFNERDLVQHAGKVVQSRGSPEEKVPQEIPAGQSMLLIRRQAYERAGLTRQAIDQHLNLTADEFRVEAGLVLIGPIPDDTGIRDILDDLEGAGLAYFDDYFELSGNWPSWIRLYVADR